ncbi:F0F1 ATP synthase subunit delta [Candidatus Dojkabacteria bacterium]|nr:F0F1 ATP synthase subunit delta [Candidatus Dojkabacteria bacterium]
MDKKEIVKNIYKLSNTTKDKALFLLEVLALIKDNEIDEILKIYTDLVNGKLKIAEVFSHNDLTIDQKGALENKVNSKFGNIELIYDYRVSEKNNPGIMVRIGDDVLDGTI